MTVAATGAAAVAAPACAGALGDPALVTPIRLSALEVAARTGVFEPWLLFLNATGRQGVQAFAQTGFALTRFALVVGIVAGGGELGGAFAGFAAASLIGLMAAVVGWILARSVAATENGFADRARRALRWNVGYDLFPLFFSGAAVWLLNVRSNDAEFIGFFCACVTVSTPFAAFGMVIGAGVYPELAKAFARGDRASLRSIVAHAARVLVLVIALTAALGAVRGPDAARLLSEAEGAGTVLVAVVLGQTCLGGLLFFLDVLAARGALRCRFRLVLGLAIAHVIGTSALLRSVGPEGAALAILLSSAVGFGATAWLTRARSVRSSRGGA